MTRPSPTADVVRALRAFQRAQAVHRENQRSCQAGSVGCTKCGASAKELKKAVETVENCFAHWEKIHT